MSLWTPPPDEARTSGLTLGRHGEVAAHADRFRPVDMALSALVLAIVVVCWFVFA